jgi:hypothetical protein
MHRIKSGSITSADKSRTNREQKSGVRHNGPIDLPSHKSFVVNFVDKARDKDAMQIRRARKIIRGRSGRLEEWCGDTVAVSRRNTHGNNFA